MRAQLLPARMLVRVQPGGSVVAGMHNWSSALLTGKMRVRVRTLYQVFRDAVQVAGEPALTFTQVSAGSIPAGVTKLFDWDVVQFG
jgi:hypothetical protein